MKSVHWPTRSARVLGPAILCLAFAAIPAGAGACDMKAVDDQLLRMAQAKPGAAMPNQSADDPSPNEDEAAKSAAKQQPSQSGDGKTSASGASNSASSQQSGGSQGAPASNGASQSR